MNRSFDNDVGWIEIPDFLDTTEVTELLAQCRSIVQQPESEQWPRDKESGTQRLVGLDQRLGMVERILGRDILNSIVIEILGTQFRRSEVGFRNPQPGFGWQFLHADAPPQTSPGPATVATAIVPLANFGPTNGATRLIPGSHRRPDLQRSSGSLEYHEGEILLTGTMGTAFVFSGHVLHSGTMNRSDRDRPALHLLWRQS